MELFLEFAGNHPVLILAAAALVVAIAVYELRLRSRGFADVLPGEAVRLMNDDGVVLDVRQPERFAAGHVAGARNVPLDMLADDGGKKLARFKDNPVIVCCETGVSSARAAAQLKKMGFGQIFNLRGGVDAWQRESYPLEKGRK